MRKKIFLTGSFAAAAAVIFFFGACSKGRSAPEPGFAHYTCGMHPDVKVSVEEYEKGNKSCPICGMNLVPVERKEGGKAGARAKAGKGEEEKKILFYRNPMNPLVTSETPAKDEMGMDYIPVYEGEEDEEEYYGDGMKGAKHVYTLTELRKKGLKDMKCPACGMKLKKISKEEADRLRGVVKRVSIDEKETELAGIQTEAAADRSLYKEIRVPARVSYDNNLYSAQKEYLSVLNLSGKSLSGMPGNLRESAERKLFILGMSAAEIRELEERGEADDSLILPSESAWVYGDVYESENYWLREGDEIRVYAESFPGKEFGGKIISIKPVLNDKTRTLVFRAKVRNPGEKLKPEMYVDAFIMRKYEGGKKVLSVPSSAVLDTGKRKIVWVETGKGKYEAREISVGPESYAYGLSGGKTFFPVSGGIRKGEKVANKGNFLIDSQSRITGVASAYGGSLQGE